MQADQDWFADVARRAKQVRLEEAGVDYTRIVTATTEDLDAVGVVVRLPREAGESDYSYRQRILANTGLA